MEMQVRFSVVDCSVPTLLTQRMIYFSTSHKPDTTERRRVRKRSRTMTTCKPNFGLDYNIINREAVYKNGSVTATIFCNTKNLEMVLEIGNTSDSGQCVECIC